MFCFIEGIMSGKQTVQTADQLVQKGETVIWKKVKENGRLQFKSLSFDLVM